mgnify:CR=1 FL=1|jgi:hypothetical protein
MAANAATHFKVDRQCQVICRHSDVTFVIFCQKGNKRKAAVCFTATRPLRGQIGR